MNLSEHNELIEEKPLTNATTRPLSHRPLSINETPTSTKFRLNKFAQSFAKNSMVENPKEITIRKNEVRKQKRALLLHPKKYVNSIH